MADRTRSSSSRVTLPEARRFISSLVGAVPRPPPALGQSSNPLKDALPVAKNIFLALHVIFPNELLPALDVLDRGLVLRLRSTAQGRSPADLVRSPTLLLLVRSAQQRPGTHRHPATEHVAYYEVRLDAWSCSCPAFAFAAFPARPAEVAGDDDDDDHDHDKPDAKTPLARDEVAAPVMTGMDVDVPGFRFGGCSRGDDLPICKHLLACVLVERCTAFGHLVEEREVAEDEMAGWAAGWGD